MLKGLTHSRSPWPASPPFSVFSFRCLHHSRSRLWNTWKTLTFSTLDFVPPEEQKKSNGDIWLMDADGFFDVVRWVLRVFLGFDVFLFALIGSCWMLRGFDGFGWFLMGFGWFLLVLMPVLPFWRQLPVKVSKSYRNDFCAWYKPPNATHQELAETKIIQNKQQRVLGSNCWVFWPWHVGPWQWSRYNPRHTWADLSMENLAGLWGPVRIVWVCIYKWLYGVNVYRLYMAISYPRIEINLHFVGPF